MLVHLVFVEDFLSAELFRVFTISLTMALATYMDCLNNMHP